MDELLLLSGNDILMAEAGIYIRQPRLKDIAYLGEERFYMGCELLNFSKDILQEKDKSILGDKTNFEIIMSIMSENDIKDFEGKENIFQIFLLLFPDYKYTMTSNKIIFQKDEEIVGEINNDNFANFLDIFNTILCLKGSDKDEALDYDPANEAAARIADKLKRGRQKAMMEKNGGSRPKINILSKYVSILSVGEHKSMESLLNYTIYQIKDEYERFLLKENFEHIFKARLAGAKDLEDGKYWMDDIHE